MIQVLSNEVESVSICVFLSCNHRIQQCGTGCARFDSLFVFLTVSYLRVLHELILVLREKEKPSKSNGCKWIQYKEKEDTPFITVF